MNTHLYYSTQTINKKDNTITRRRTIACLNAGFISTACKHPCKKSETQCLSPHQHYTTKQTLRQQKGQPADKRKAEIDKHYHMTRIVSRVVWYFSFCRLDIWTLIMHNQHTLQTKIRNLTQPSKMWEIFMPQLTITAENHSYNNIIFKSTHELHRNTVLFIKVYTWITHQYFTYIQVCI